MEPYFYEYTFRRGSQEWDLCAHPDGRVVVTTWENGKFLLWEDDLSILTLSMVESMGWELVR